MILGFDNFWVHYLKDIDIKTNEWPWTDEYWENEAKKNIIKTWLEKDDDGKGAKTPRGFVAYRFVSLRTLIGKGQETIIHILKLAVHPSWRNRGIGIKLLESVEVAAKLQNVNSLAIILHEEYVESREWLVNRDFKAVKLHKSVFPDGRDGYSFFKEVES